MNNKLLIELNKLVEQIKYDIDNPSPILSKKEKIGNRYRLKNIKNAIEIIKKYPKKIKSGNDISHIPGIGKGIMNRVNEILLYGKLKEIKIKSKEKKYMSNIEELEKIIGIGRKTAYDLVMNHNIKSVKELKEAYTIGKISLPDNILIGLKYYELYDDNIPRKEIDKISEYLHNIIDTINKNINITICGSYRRGKLKSSDIDILMTHKNIKTKNDITTKKNYLHTLVQFLKKKNFLIDDITFNKYEYKYMGFCKFKNYPIRRIDIRYVPYESYYTAILYFTGSGDFNSKMRNIAKLLGYKLNEYGLYKIKSSDKFKLVKVKSEKDIFNILDMEYLEPSQR
jgi:DNA polymerase beta